MQCRSIVGFVQVAGDGIGFKQLKDPVVLVAVGFGSGLAPKAPGTAGTLVAIPLYLLMQPINLLATMSLPLCIWS